MRARIGGALLGVSVLVAGACEPALAHDPKPRHGGSIVIAGSYHVELVTNGTQVDVYLLDHGDKPVATKGRKGLAILVIDGKSVRIPLASSEDKKLSGISPTAAAGAPKGVVQITEPTGGTVNARFK
jgi:hypothetical protein